MSDRDAHLLDAKVISKGTFKLDSRRAMKKLAQFQLEDPHRYVLELVSAAVGAGARSLTIRNDADDLELTWDGAHPTADELDSLFDHIFYQGDEPRQRMLQHLAQGIYGALGLEPRWILLQRPGLTLDLTDPLAPVRTDNTRTDGVHIHVRERFSWTVIKEAITPFDSAYETRLLRSLAFLAPMPIVVNGADITADPPAPPETVLVRTMEGGTVWLHDDREALDPRLQDGVQVVRDGICVQSIEVSCARYRLVGWVRCRHITLNASRSDVVVTAPWLDLTERLWKAAEALVAEALSRTPADEDLRDAALTLVQHRASSHAVLQDFPLLRDAVGREWSLADLTRRGQIWTVDEVELPTLEIAAPQFLHRVALRHMRRTAVSAREETQWTVLTQLLGSKLHDGTPALRRLAHGRRRRQELARRGVAWAFPDALVSHEFTEGDCTVILALFEETSLEQVTVEILVDELPVQETVVSSIATMRARIKGGDLEADPTFLMVLDTPTRRSIPLRIHRGITALLLKAAAEQPSHPTVRRALLRWMAKKDAFADALQDTALFLSVSGTHRSLAQIKATAQAERTIRFIRHARYSEVIALLRGASAQAEHDDVLFLDPDASRVLKPIFGRRLVDRSDAILDTLKAAQRRSLAPVTPKLTETLDAMTAVVGGSFSGVIGLRASGAAPSVQVIHKGVDLGTIEIPLRLPGALASISWETARPNAAWDGLCDPARQRRLLADLLEEPLRALAVASVSTWRTQASLPAWVVTLLSSPTSAALVKQPWFTALDGELYSIQQLKKMAPIHYLSERPSSLPPGLGVVLLLDDGRRQILETHVSAVRSAEAMLRKLQNVRKRYFEKATMSPRLPARARLVCRARFETPTLKGEIGVCDDGDASPGVRIKVLAHERLLTELKLAHFLPMVAIVDGSAVRPQSRLAGVEDPAAILDIVKVEVDRAVRRLVENAGAPIGLQRMLLLQLLREAPVPGAEDATARAAVLDRLRSRRLFPCLSGEPASLNALVAAHAENQLRVVLSPGGVPSDARLWVKVCEDRIALLKAVLGQRLPDGEGELRVWRKAAKRRETLARVGRHIEEPWKHAATWVVEEEGAEAWVGLLDDRQTEMILEWRIEERIIATESLPCAAPILVRITDPAVAANPAFTGPARGAAQDRARDWAQSLVPRFMLRIAQGAQLQSAPVSADASLTLNDKALCRSWALKWAGSTRLSKAWSTLALVSTSAGEYLSPPALKVLGSTGPIRVVGPTVTGMTLDEKRPAIQLRVAERHSIKAYGKLTDFTKGLAREAKIQERRSCAPTPQTPKPGVALLTRDAPGERAGFVEVRVWGASRINLYVGWRPLGHISSKGPVPLFGHISDDALSPNSEFLRVHRDGPYRALQRALTAMSTALLPEVLQRTDPIENRELLLAILLRAFQDKRDLQAAAGVLGTLADLPLFVSGTGESISARQLTVTSPRWVPPGETWPSLDATRPFVCASPEELKTLKPLLGGSWEASRAESERRIIQRQGAQRRPFVLPQETIGPPIERKFKDFRGVFGLVAEQVKGWIYVRCRGIPVETRMVSHPGLVGVLEVPRRVVNADWTRARLFKGMSAALFTVHEDCIQAAAPRIRGAASLSAWVSSLIAGKKKKSAKVFLRAPLLETVEGICSINDLLSQAQSGTTILLGTHALEAEKTLVVREDIASSEILLDACGIRYHSVQSWSASLQKTLEAEAQARRLRAQQEREAALESAVRRHHIALLSGPAAMTTVAIRALPVDLTGFPLHSDALAAPGSTAGLLAAAWVAEAYLRPSIRQLMLVRLGALLSREETDDTAR